MQSTICPALLFERMPAMPASRASSASWESRYIEHKITAVLGQFSAISRATHNPVGFRHEEIQHNNVRRQFECLQHRLVSVFCFAADFPAVVPLDHAADAGANGL